MSDLYWYACIFESESRIIFGRAPVGGEPDQIVEAIKESLHFHDLIGFRSKVFLRGSRLFPDAVIDYCEEKAEKNRGEYRGYKVVKLDLRWDPEESHPAKTD